MRKRIFLWVVLFTFCLSLILPSRVSFAVDQSVRVSLPEFVVKLNGNKVENHYREYPLLMYKDITYFPMTWYDSRLLGLETEWTQKDGLKIVKEKVASSYISYKTNHENSTSYKATISKFNFTLNGKIIDNSKEEYPLLSFNNVTYFPLTWKFAHDEFGWEYVWDGSEGLSINSKNSQVKTVNLPTYAGENGVAVFKDYFYFTETVGSSNQIYRVPVNNTSNKELVYSYKVDGSNISKYLRFEIRDNELWFSYHDGGAVMGSDVYGKVNYNGKATIEHQGYLDFKKTPFGTLIINFSVPPFRNNLYLVPSGQADKDNHDFSANGKNVGNPNLIYGWCLPFDGTCTGFYDAKSTTIIGDDVYVLASPYPDGNGDLNRIYRINLKTNETEKIINSNVDYFKIMANQLYYVKKADHALYASNLDGANEQKITANQVTNWYGEIDGNVYYTVANAKGQFNLYKAEPSKKDKLVLIEPLESVQLVNDKLICKLAAGEDYGVKVLDRSGNLHLAITDQASVVFAYNDLILMVSTEDKSIKLVQVENEN